MVKESTCDISFDLFSSSSVTLRIKFIQIMLNLKLIWNIDGQTVRNHSIDMSSNIMLLAVLIATVSKNCNSPNDNHTERGM